MKITEQERVSLIRRSAYAWSHFQENGNAVDILSKIYCHNLIDKSPKQGELMTTELLLWMARFQDCYDAALEDPAAYTEYILTQELDALPLQQQCQALEQVIQASQSADASESVLPYHGTVSPQARDSLRQEAVQRITNGEDTAVLEQILLAADDAEPHNRKLVKTICGEDMVLAVNAMVLYTMAKNGELSEIPKDVSLAQVAIGACTEDQFRSISRDERQGCLSKEAAAKRKQALTTAFRAMMLLSSVALAGGFAMLLARSTSIRRCLIIGAALLAALGVIVAEKFKLDRQMVEDQADEIVEIPLKLPRATAVWTRTKAKQDQQTTVPGSSENLEDPAEQEDTEESVLRLF